MMDCIKLININKTYGKDDYKVEALKEINLTIQDGELLAIMGTSGSGKSTLLNLLGCLDRFDKGSYYLNEKDVSQLSKKELAKIRNKNFGFVIQYFGLLDDYTVYENIQIHLEYAKVPNKKKKILVKSMLDKLGIINKIDVTPQKLSGGQSQRVAIARALVNNPNIILADEPTGALDKKTANEVLDILVNLNKEGKTVVIVTHDENIAKRCKRIIKIEDGRIVEDKENL